MGSASGRSSPGGDSREWYEDEVGSSELVDVRVTSVGEIPGAIAGLYAS